MVRVECLGMEGGTAETLAAALGRLVEGLQERDPDLARTVPPRLVVADDFTAALAEEGVAASPGTVMQAVAGSAGRLLVIDGRRAAAALAGAPGDLARLVHLLHREWWRMEAVERRRASPAPAANDLERHLQPVVEALWAEYLSTRRSVASLPADADLLLPHLAELLDALPPATAGDITLAAAEGGKLDDLFGRALGRVAHLMQVVGHVQGYLAGLGESLESLSPEFAARLQASFLGPRWGRGARLLEALHGSDGQWDGEFLHNTLRPEVLAALAALGLDLRPTGDGGVWLEPRPLVH